MWNGLTAGTLDVVLDSTLNLDDPSIVLDFLVRGCEIGVWLKPIDLALLTIDR